MEATDNTGPETAAAATVGDFLRRRRIELGLTQAELCRKLGKHQVWASQRECGHAPVRDEDVQDLAEALQVDAAELRTIAGIPNQPVEPTTKADSPVVGVVTEETVTAQVLRWQVGDRSVPIEDLNREDLIGAVRSLFAANAELKADFERGMGEVAEMYEQKVRSLHLALAAQVELDIRDAVRDKMEMILEAVMAEIEHRRITRKKETNHSQKEAAYGH